MHSAELRESVVEVALRDLEVPVVTSVRTAVKVWVAAVKVTLALITSPA